MSEFDPKKFMTFEQGLKRIETACLDAGLIFSDKVVTSKDSDSAKATEALMVTNIPEGVSRWQLPFFVERSQFFLSVASPYTKVPQHSHSDTGVRLIISGSLKFKDQELTAGDWMYVPANVPYSFEAGPQGATFFACYQGSCA
jgi:hypothetical protein